jgi:hypothetical protein
VTSFFSSEHKSYSRPHFQALKIIYSFPDNVTRFYALVVVIFQKKLGGAASGCPTRDFLSMEAMRVMNSGLAWQGH